MNACRSISISPRRAALLFCVLLIACARPEPEQPRLVLLFAPCSVNASYLSPYNSQVQYTPHLGAFAEDATVFMRHQTETGQSGTGYASIFSGLQTPGHGVYSHPMQLPDAVQLITEVFTDQGYTAFAWLSHSMASAILNYAQGVEPAHSFRQFLTADDPHFQAILDRLERDATFKAFIVTNPGVAHTPYLARLERVREFCREYANACHMLRDPAQMGKYARMFRHRTLALSYDFQRTTKELGLSDGDVRELTQVIDILYKQVINRLDRLFGAIVDEIAARNFLDQSLIVFTADHGEVLFRDNALFYWAHGYQLAPEVLNVPLIVRGPRAGVEAAVYDSVTRSVDLLPTLAGLSQLQSRDYAGPGVDLSAVLHGRDEAPDLIAMSHTPIVAPLVRESVPAPLAALFPREDPELMWVSARSGDTVFKLRNVNGRLEPSVFDLAADPTESTDLHDPTNREHTDMVAALKRYREQLVAGFTAWSPRRLSDEKASELLRSLGYIE